jgi:hypothetical protein
LKKPYLVCATLILIDSNIVKIQPLNTRTTKVVINAPKIPKKPSHKSLITDFQPPKIRQEPSTSKNKNKNL